MNISQAHTHNAPVFSNIAQSEIVDFVRNDAMIHSIDSARSASHAHADDTKQQAPKVELWPFTVKIVSTPEQLAKAVKLRHDAYAKHVPDMAAKLLNAEEADEHDIVLLVESKFDGSALGTMRIRTNDTAPLQIEHVIDMPQAMQGRRLAGAARLAVKGAGGSFMVKDALFKAFYLICQQLEIDYMVISARKPLDRMYEKLDFQDIGEKGELIALPYADNIPHRVMVSEVKTFYSRWTQRNHPLCDFIWNTTHPDMRVDVSDEWKNEEQEDTAQILRFA
jgi:predicted GNAT family N-acyltransferase